MSSRLAITSAACALLMAAFVLFGTPSAPQPFGAERVAPQVSASAQEVLHPARFLGLLR